MAVRRIKLQHRIAAAGHNTARAMGAYHPAGTAATPMVMPLAAVVVSAAPGGAYADLGSVEYAPMWAPGGEMIPAVAPGTWGQLRAAGRP